MAGVESTSSVSAQQRHEGMMDGSMRKMIVFVIENSYQVIVPVYCTILLSIP